MSKFSFQRRVAFYETDAMGVMHHSNHFRIMEEARVAWLNASCLAHIHYPLSDKVLAVVKASIKYYRPLFFNDLLEVVFTASHTKVRVVFHYQIMKLSESTEQPQLAAEGPMELIFIDDSRRPCKLPSELIYHLEQT